MFNVLSKCVVLVVGICGMAAADEPNESPAPVNERWIAAQHLAPKWESIMPGTRHFNPETSAVGPRPLRRSVSFEGRMEVIDPNGLIGLWEVAQNTRAFDEVGMPLDSLGFWEQMVVRGYPPLTPYYKPLVYFMTIEETTGQRVACPFRVTIDMTVLNDGPFPRMLSRLEWSMSALLSDNVRSIDIPLAVTTDWTQLVPGLEVLVEEASVKNGEFNYRMKARYDPNEVCYLDSRTRIPGFVGRDPEIPYSWPGNAFPKRIVTTLDVLNAQGRSVWAQTGRHLLSGYGRFSDSGGQRIVTGHFTGTCADCGNAAFIRHVIAYQPYSQQLQFVLENVPIPTE